MPARFEFMDSLFWTCAIETVGSSVDLGVAAGLDVAELVLESVRKEVNDLVS